MALQSCARRPWRIGDTYLNPRGTALMGILNVTPDSFHDGGFHNSLDKQFDQAMQMISEGAAIIDIGGESSRPNAAVVSVDEELSRVIPIIKKLSGTIDPAQIFISIDTTKAPVAQKAVESGATIINDISALTTDKKMIDVVIETGASVVLNHIQGTPQTMQNKPDYTNLFDDIISSLDHTISQLTHKGYPLSKVCVDPGIGFGKTVSHNYQLIWEMYRLSVLNCPILMGMSRKSYIGKTTGLEQSDRLIPSITSAVISSIAGASIIRVHDVKETKEALTLSEAIQYER
ncbi:MAG: dihydropteroate synthase [Fibrobacterales bacterium]